MWEIILRTWPTWDHLTCLQSPQPLQLLLLSILLHWVRNAHMAPHCFNLFHRPLHPHPWLPAHLFQLTHPSSTETESMMHFLSLFRYFPGSHIHFSSMTPWYLFCVCLNCIHFWKCYSYMPWPFNNTKLINVHSSIWCQIIINPYAPLNKHSCLIILSCSNRSQWL